MVNVYTETVIHRPAGVVAAFAANPANVPQWYQNIASVLRTSPDGPLLGSHWAFVAHFLGRTLSYEYKIVEFVADERLVMRTSQGPFPMETIYTWVALNDTTTRMTVRNAGEPSGFSRLASPLIAVAMRAANRKDLQKIKALLEA